MGSVVEDNVVDDNNVNWLCDVCNLEFVSFDEAAACEKKHQLQETTISLKEATTMHDIIESAVLDDASRLL
jgi:hypothetical protein